MARKKYDIPRLPRAEKAHRRQLEAILAGEWQPPRRDIKYSYPELAVKLAEYYKAHTARVPAEIDGAPVLDEKGRQVYKTVEIDPMGVSSVCSFLGITRQTWFNWRKKSHPLSDLVKTFDTVITSFLEVRLNTRNSTSGTEFVLINNYGYSDKVELELGEETRRSAAITSIGLNAKINLVAGALKAYAAENPAETAENIRAALEDAGEVVDDADAEDDADEYGEGNADNSAGF
jgi:hypothetical protein